MRYEENPFNILHVSMRDSQDKILDKVEDLSLTLDEALCSQASAILTNPTKRLEAEVSWFPGYTPKKIKEAFEDAKSTPDEFIDNLSEELSYADVNAEILAFLNISYRTLLKDYLVKIASDLEKIDVGELFNELNKARNVAGIPAIPNIDLLETAVQNRQKELSEIIYSFLKSFGQDQLVKIITSAIEESTNIGKLESKTLLLQLIEKYEIDIQTDLEAATNNVEQQVSYISDSVDKGISNEELNSAIDLLDSSLRSWDRLAQPIQVSMQSQGLEHSASKDLAYSVRQLALKLYNEHSQLDASKRIIHLMKIIFAEVLTVAEKTDEDISILNNLNDRDSYINKASLECKKCMEEVEKNPAIGYENANRLQNSLKNICSFFMNESMKNVMASVELLNQYLSIEELYINAMLQCIMSYGNATKEWKKCQKFIARNIISHTNSDKIQNTARKYESIIINNIQVQRGYGALNPFFDMPSLRTIFGCGFKLYGYSDSIEIDTGISLLDPRYPNKTLHETTYVATYCFSLFSIPIFPLARYRISDTYDGKIRFYGKMPLTIGNKIHIAISLVILICLLMAMFISDNSRTRRSKKNRYSYFFKQEYAFHEDSQNILYEKIKFNHPI